MKIAWRVLLGYFVIVAIAALMLGQVFLEQVKPAVRQTAEDTLADTANSLAALAADDLASGRINDGQFAASLRTLGSREINANIWGYGKPNVAYRITVTDARGIVVFDSQGKDLGRDNSRWNDVARTLRGEYGARSTQEIPYDQSSTVMWVAAPIKHEGKLIGVLSVGKPNRVIQPFIAASRNVIMRWGLLLLGIALLIGVAMAWWLSRQLGLLRSYAQAVTAGENVPPPNAAAEFGELGSALEQMRQQLDGKQYVEEYVHTLTHELKSPLAAIRGAAELLETDLPEEDRKRFAANVLSQSERMAEMVDRLLALAAVEHRRTLDNPTRVDMAALMDEALLATRAKAESAGVTVQSKVEPGAYANGDAFLLRQACVNLIDNAIDFSLREGVVSCTVSRVEGRVVISVEDMGHGIPDYALPRVFERFYSLPRTAGGSRSSGLGLSFVAAIAALHGGHAKLENTGSGARAEFTVSG